MPVMTIISQFAVVLSLFGLLFVLEPVIALLAVGLFGGSYLLVFFAARRALARIGAVVLAANDARFKAVHEVMTSIKDVKILGVERRSWTASAPDLPDGDGPVAQRGDQRDAARPAGDRPRRHAGADPLPLVPGSGILVDILPTLGRLRLRRPPAVPGAAVALPRVRQAQGGGAGGRRALRRHHGDPGARRWTGRRTAPALPLRDRLELDGISFAYPQADRTALQSSTSSSPRKLGRHRRRHRRRQDHARRPHARPALARRGRASGWTACRSRATTCAPGRRTSATCRSRSR